MRLYAHLVRSRHGIYYARLRLPSHAGLNKLDVRRSLGTRDPRIAAILAIQLRAALAPALEAVSARTARAVPTDSLGVTKELDMRVMKWEAQVDEHGRVKVKADPDNPRDQAAAASVLVQLVRERWQAISAAHAQGAASSAPALPAAAAQPAAQPATMGLSELLEHWQRTKGSLLADKSRAEYLGMFKRFEAWLKDQRIELHDVHHTHLARYRSHCAVQIKPKTWNKHCIALSSLLGEALHLGAIRGPDNPARGLLHNKNALRKTSVARVPFTAEELQRVFAAEPYKALPKPHEYWVPLLCLHQALRANEACQLKLKDLDFEATPPQLRVCAADEDQQVKTEQSQRTLPLHPRLIELGLREYVASVRAVCGSNMAIACFSNQQQTALQRLRSVAPSA